MLNKWYLIFLVLYYNQTQGTNKMGNDTIKQDVLTTTWILAY